MRHGRPRPGADQLPPAVARHRTLAPQPFHLLILDEAQTVKNAGSRTANAVRRLQARHRLCLTGTPVENHLGELWAQFDFLMPGYLGDARSFQRRWRTPIEQHGETARPQLLAQRVRPFILRRRKADVATELPPLTEQSTACHWPAPSARCTRACAWPPTSGCAGCSSAEGFRRADQHPRRAAQAAPGLLRPAPAGPRRMPSAPVTRAARQDDLAVPTPCPAWWPRAGGCWCSRSSPACWPWCRWRCRRWACRYLRC
jgi:hypothetical protein